MAELRPFRALRYDEPRAGAPSDLISPPYDVVDAALYGRLRARSPYNVVRLTLPAGPPADAAATPPGRDEDYAAAGRLLQSWIEAGVLRRDPSPALYVCEQTFEARGARWTRTGLVALVRLAEFGQGIHPHERTHAAPKADRLKLLHATRANLEHVFALYDDPPRRVEETLGAAARPLAEAHGDDGVVHRLAAVRERRAIEEVCGALRETDLVIADGHHRYETALAYARERADSPAAQWLMMTLVNARDPGLVVLPTHRLLTGGSRLDLTSLRRAAGAWFDVRPWPGAADDLSSLEAQVVAASEAGRYAVGAYMGRGAGALVTLRDVAALDALESPAACRRLAVTALHALLFERGFGLNAAAQAARVCYVQALGGGVREAGETVDQGQAQALFLLPPTPVESVLRVAREGGRMPQKSTFFHPKVFSGLVMRTLDDAEVAGGEVLGGEAR